MTNRLKLFYVQHGVQKNIGTSNKNQHKATVTKCKRLVIFQQKNIVSLCNKCETQKCNKVLPWSFKDN